MAPDRRIRKLNQVLLAELGERPVYAWIFGARLFYPMPKYCDDGVTLRYGYRCACGLDATVHRSRCNGMVVAEALYELRNPFPDLSNRWVLCSRQFANGDGRLLNQYYWVPLGFRNSAGRSDTVCLQPGELPAQETTWEFVRMCRESRSHTLKALDAAESATTERSNKRRQTRMIDDIRNDMSLSIHPGRKEEMSFPSVPTSSRPAKDQPISGIAANAPPA